MIGSVNRCLFVDVDVPWIKLLSFGTSPQGRDLMLIVASKEGAFDPAAARAAGKPVCVMVNSAEEAESFQRLGANAFIVSSDQGFMRRAAAQALKDFTKPAA